jgi:hypothetical protein
MNEPSVFLYRNQNSLIELFLGLYNPTQCFQLFDGNIKIKIIKVELIDTNKKDLITEDDLKYIFNFHRLIEFFQTNSQIELKHLEIEIEKFGRLRVINKSICIFCFLKEENFKKLLPKIINDRDSKPLEISLIDNQNKYLVYLESGNIEIYQTYDDYLNMKLLN